MKLHVMLALALVAPAFADRYICKWGDLPEIYTPDARSMAGSIEAAAGGMRPASIQIPLALPALGPIAAVNITIPADPNAAMNRIVTQAPPTTATVVTRGADLAPPSPGPISPEFNAALDRIYSQAVQAEREQIWGLFQREPTTLPLDQRVGNAVVKFLVRVGTARGDARPDLLKPNSTRGTVRSSNGIGVRSQPWGPPQGAAIGGGAGVDLVPPAQGPWYQLRSGGWVAGIWLDLQ